MMCLGADFLVFVLLGVFCDFRIRSSVSLILAFLGHYSFKYFQSPTLCSVSDVPVPGTICPSELCHSSLLFCLLHSFFSLHFTFGGFCDLIFKLRDSLLGCVQPTDEPPIALSISVAVFLICSMPSFPFYSLEFPFFSPFFLRTLPTYCSCLLFPLEPLNPWCGNSKICIISEANFNACFFFKLLLFFFLFLFKLLFSVPSNFLLES